MWQANAKLHHRRDTLASRYKRKPDIDTIESCAKVKNYYADLFNRDHFFTEVESTTNHHKNILFLILKKSFVFCSTK